MAQPYKRSLIPVVNRRFQYKYTAIIIGIAGFLTDRIIVAINNWMLRWSPQHHG